MPESVTANSRRRTVQSQDNMDSNTRCHVYTLLEASEVLGVDPITVRRLIARGVLHRVPFIRHIRIPKAEVDRLAEGVRP